MKFAHEVLGSELALWASADFHSPGNGWVERELYYQGVVLFATTGNDQLGYVRTVTFHIQTE